MKSEASKLPKGLVLGRYENIHIRLTGSYNFYMALVPNFIICM